MAKKDRNKDENNNENELEEIKEELEDVNEKEELGTKVQELEKQLEEYKQIAWNSQNQYLILKNDFDSYKSRVEKAQKDQELNTLIDVSKKMIPIIEELRKTLDNMPEDLEWNSWAEWIKVLYKSMIKKLESMNIYQYDSIWLDLDENYHEPISSVPDSENAGKIVDEFEKLYIYKKEDKEKIVQVAKVVVAVD